MSNSQEIHDFVTLACRRSRDYVSSSETLYRHYVGWCDGLEPMGRRRFVRLLGAEYGVRYGVHRIDGKTQRGFEGVGLKKGAEPKSKRYPPATPSRTRRPATDNRVQTYQFLTECCEVVPENRGRVSSDDLFTAYDFWAGDRADRLQSKKALTQAIGQALGRAVRYGVHWIDGQAERGFKGLRLKSS